ncbi:MAG: hypothetical protein ACLP7Q_26040 [Isosphaeraceae bacterium]
MAGTLRPGSPCRAAARVSTPLCWSEVSACKERACSPLGSTFVPRLEPDTAARRPCPPGSDDLAGRNEELLIAAPEGEIGPGLLPIPARTLFVGTRESSFSWSKTEKQHTISTLRIMLGTTWRFMVGGSR